MARHNLAEVQTDGENEVSTKPAPPTLGDLLPGIVGTVKGVNMHALPLGLVGALIVAAVESEVRSAGQANTRGLKSEDDKDAYEFAKNSGESAAISALSAGLMPSDMKSEAECIGDSAVNFMKNHVNGLADADAWFEQRFNDDERSKASDKNSKSKSQCIKRVAHEWIGKATESLPVGGQKAHARVIEEGKAAYAAALDAATKKSAAATAALLDPMGAPEVVEEAAADIGV